jgi:hypothetical protein
MNILSVIAASRRRFDADTVAFSSASGATDLSGIDAIARYMRSEGLRSNYRLYPKRSAQNAGSGSTVYGIGELTANNMTLVGSPTWGSGGIAMNTTTQYAHIADFLDNDTVTCFIRRSGAVGSAISFMASQWDFSGNERSWAVVSGGSGDATKFRLQRSLDGETVNAENYETATGKITTSSTCYVGQWIAGGGRSAWINKTSQSLTLQSGSAQTARLDSPDSILINAAGVVGSVAALAGGTYTAFCVVRGTITTTQRETLTDLINAL